MIPFNGRQTRPTPGSTPRTSVQVDWPRASARFPRTRYAEKVASRLGCPRGLFSRGVGSQDPRSWLATRDRGGAGGCSHGRSQTRWRCGPDR